jgi:hypothetical protein
MEQLSNHNTEQRRETDGATRFNIFVKFAESNTYGTLECIEKQAKDVTITDDQYSRPITNHQALSGNR